MLIVGCCCKILQDRIKQALTNHEAALKERSLQFEAELETKLKLMEDKIESKRRASELREVELSQREDLISEKEHDLEVQKQILSTNTFRNYIEQKK